MATQSELPQLEQVKLACAEHGYREASHMLGEWIVKAVHRLAKQNGSLDERRLQLQAIHQACHEELDDEETDED